MISNPITVDTIIITIITIVDITAMVTREKGRRVEGGVEEKHNLIREES